MADLRNKLKTASFSNQSLQDILKSCSVAIELISVEPYTGAIRQHFKNDCSCKSTIGVTHA